MTTIEEHSTLERFPLLGVKCSDVKIYVNKTELCVDQEPMVMGSWCGLNMLH